MQEAFFTTTSAVPLCSTLTHFSSLRSVSSFKTFSSIHPVDSLFLNRKSNLSNLIFERSHERSTLNSTVGPHFTDDSSWDFPIEGFEKDEDEGSPWEGAIVYKRNSSLSHLEYCTTLERLGLAKVSSEVSKIRSSEMGLRVAKSVEDYPNGTPVIVSVDVTRKKQKLRLDGIVRTVIALACNRCGEPAAQSVYSDFSVLLCEEAIQEPETMNFGVIFGEDKSKPFGLEEDDDDDDDALIDFDDQLYFPPERKTVDISKNIRDLIHVEITMNAICDPNCKGLCLNCGTNLNISNCKCKAQSVSKNSYGPFGDLRKKMNQT